ncbi:hypothetical protein DZF91_13295 [Actinomadura logoneensis]|uniref:Uncharacterized protein n=1 Tax=Actinomadura logoneensis TaxID=2293572 RepID=A0A372JMK7_9ACTN|nr:hypothetical protein DZF91_13295 [Actinomadura logoneensis]
MLPFWRSAVLLLGGSAARRFLRFGDSAVWRLGGLAARRFGGSAVRLFGGFGGFGGACPDAGSCCRSRVGCPWRRPGSDQRVRRCGHGR